jgi:uncharacterized membrane protein
MKAKSLEESTRIVVLAAAVALVVAVGWRVLANGISAAACAWAVLCTAPLWLPLRWLVQRNRRTYAMFTLCIIPYLVTGLTEAVANPIWRGWAAFVLCVSFLTFVSLIAYLRVTRPDRT